jgi:cystathionine gamma-synthase
MNTRTSKWQPASLAAQALGWVERETGEIVPPIHVSTTYERDPANPGRHGRIYSRDDNPTYEQAEALLNTLEGGAGCRLFASGMAAAAAIFQALRQGDHVIVPEVVYWGVRRVAKDLASGWGIAVDFLPNGDLDALSSALRPGTTRIVWLETPSNPTLAIADIEASARLAHGAGAKLLVDNTFATPVLTRPFEHGADLVMHSATKYLNGHSDVIAGALVARESDGFWERIGAVRRFAGAVIGPFEAWLLLRGMRTLFVRHRVQCANALELARHFHGHPGIVQTLYPGLPDHAGHEAASRQMTGGYGAMLSLRIAGGEPAALRLWAGTRLWKVATSLGGVESLIEHRASIEGPDSPVPRDLMRLSVGIEDVGDLIADLETALNQV